MHTDRTRTVLWIFVALLALTGSIAGLFWSDFYEISQTDADFVPDNLETREAPDSVWERKPTVDGEPAATYEDEVEPQANRR
jgi:hypothetical protein